jgi:hypothetical protein
MLPFLFRSYLGHSVCLDVFPVLVSSLGSFSTRFERITISRNGSFVLVTDLNTRLGLVDLASAQYRFLAGSTIAGYADGQGSSVLFGGLGTIAISNDDSFALIPDPCAIRHIVISTGVVTTLAGGACNGTANLDGVGTMASITGIRGISISLDGSFALIAQTTGIRRLNMTSRLVSTAALFANALNVNAHFVMAPNGLFALLVENTMIRLFDVASSSISTLAGTAASGFQNGVGTNARFYGLGYGVAIDPTSTYALIVATVYFRIHRIVIATGEVSTLAGTGVQGSTDGNATWATFHYPMGIDIRIIGFQSFAIITDLNINTLRRIDLASPCSAGYFCNATGLSSARFACSAGYYCPAGSTSATQASCNVPGFYCPVGSSSATQSGCDSGFYCNQTGLSSNASQVLCTAGSYCASGSSSDAPCPPGFYCPSPSSKLPCSSAGYFCNATGLTASTMQTPCRAGFYCIAGSSTASQFSCSAGNYCLSGSSASSGNGSCSAGFYCPTASSSSTQVPCLMGYVCPQGSFNLRGAVDGQGILHESFLFSVSSCNNFVVVLSVNSSSKFYDVFISVSCNSFVIMCKQ